MGYRSPREVLDKIGGVTPHAFQEEDEEEKIEEEEKELAL